MFTAFEDRLDHGVDLGDLGHCLVSQRRWVNRLDRPAAGTGAGLTSSVSASTVTGSTGAEHCLGPIQSMGGGSPQSANAV